MDELDSAPLAVVRNRVAGKDVATARHEADSNSSVRGCRVAGNDVIIGSRNEGDSNLIVRGGIVGYGVFTGTIEIDSIPFVVRESAACYDSIIGKVKVYSSIKVLDFQVLDGDASPMV